MALIEMSADALCVSGREVKSMSTAELSMRLLLLSKRHHQQVCARWDAC